MTQNQPERNASRARPCRRALRKARDGQPGRLAACRRPARRLLPCGAGLRAAAASFTDTRRWPISRFRPRYCTGHTPYQSHTANRYSLGQASRRLGTIGGGAAAAIHCMGCPPWIASADRQGQHLWYGMRRVIAAAAWLSLFLTSHSLRSAIHWAPLHQHEKLQGGLLHCSPTPSAVPLLLSDSSMDLAERGRV